MYDLIRYHSSRGFTLIGSNPHEHYAERGCNLYSVTYLNLLLIYRFFDTFIPKLWITFDKLPYDMDMYAS